MGTATSLGLISLVIPNRNEESCLRETVLLLEPEPTRSGTEHGFGRAVVRGFQSLRGDAIAIMMADISDDSADVVRYREKLNEGCDCVFVSRYCLSVPASGWRSA